MALRVYKVSAEIDGKAVEIKESVDTNYRDGEAKQLANLFYRIMLASGHTPAVVCGAFAGVAQSGGLLQGEDQAGLFDYGGETGGDGGGDD